MYNSFTFQINHSTSSMDTPKKKEEEEEEEKEMKK